MKATRDHKICIYTPNFSVLESTTFFCQDALTSTYNHNQTSTNGTYTRSAQCGSRAFFKRKDHINLKTQPHVQQTYGVECNVNWYSTSLQ